MNWFRENPFVSGLAIFVVVASGALIFLTTRTMSEYSEISDQYTQAVQKLHGLQNRSPFPNAENLAKSKALEAEYKAELTALQEQLAKLEPPVNPDIKPQQFQDDLRAAVNDVMKKAAEKQVTLPRDFYLGFSQYVNSLPNDKAAPLLARQLTVIKEIVDNLIDVGVQSIDGLTRRPLPEEQPSAAQAQRKPAIVERFPFDIAFTTDQSKFRIVFNGIQKSNRFLIIRALNLSNTSQDGPPVVQDNAQTSVTATASLAGTGVEGSKELNVILGRELVKVSLRLEMIAFNFPKPEAKN
jgi:hypothetical protein